MKELLKKTLSYKIFRSCRRQIWKSISRNNPKKYVGIIYKAKLGKAMNWNNPKDINEKINWMKIYTDTSLWSLLADKYAVRKYVSDKGLDKILIPLIGVWKSANDIDWDSLPNQFVMKMNNGSGDILICKDKTTLNTEYYVKRFNQLLSIPYGIDSGEPHYSSISPLIIAEELLDASKQDFSSTSLIDYKIWCFNGIPHHVWCSYNRSKDSVEVEVHDLDWNYHPEHSVSVRYYKEGKGKIPKPSNLDDLLSIASTLSKGFKQVRVDLYIVDNTIYFGEYTFTSDGGYMDFYTDDFLLEMGQQFTLK